MKQTSLLLMVLQVPVDYFMLLLAAMSAYALRFSDWAVLLKPVEFSLTYGAFLENAAQVSLVFVAIFALSGLYTADPHKKLLGVFSTIFLACTTGLGLIALYLLFSQGAFDSRFLLAGFWIFGIVYVSIGRVLFRAFKAMLYRLGFGLSHVVLIGDSAMTDSMSVELSKRRGLGYKVLKQFKTFNEKTAKQILKLGPDELIFANPRAQEAEALEALEWAHEHHISFQYSADLFATFSVNMTVHPLAGVPIVRVGRTKLGGWGHVMKRLFDIVGSLILIIITSPLMLLSSIVILFETGRPVIYKNTRVGTKGHEFKTLKFRSMFVERSTGEGYGGAAAAKEEKELIKNQNTKSGPLYKVGDDPRITRFGQFIRKWSIDELPQFFNVLGGSMSLIGPRPHQPREVEKYERQHKRVLTVKPGVSGLSQISGRSDLSFEEEVQLDVFYIENWTLMLDVIILLKTPFILFKKRSAL